MKGELSMKKMVSIMTILAIMCGCVMGLTGCDGGTTSKQLDLPLSTSIVLGVHENFPKIPFNTNSLYSTIYDSAYSWGNVSAIVVDGEPSVRGNWDIQDPGKNINDAKKKQLAKNSTNAIVSNLTQVKATVPEIDTLKAIQVGANALNSTTDCKKSLIIFDAGLSTAGVLNFVEKNILDVPVEVVVEQLNDMHAIPNLSGVDVTWIGLGQVCGSQEALPSSYKYKLQTLWNEILKASGATTITFDTSPLALEENACELPKCSVVPIVADCLELSSATLPEAVKFDENSSVKFKGDKAEFIDASAAEKELMPIAEYLRANPDEYLYILGMTATVAGSNFGKELSVERAEACKKLLVNNGVQEAQLVCIGLGQTPNPLRVNDIDENGLQIEELAKINRAVFFVKQDSELVEKIIKPYIEAESI